MITRSKLTNQPENKLTNKFQPIDVAEERRHEKSRKNKKRLTIVLMPVLLLIVAGATFGIMWLASGKHQSTEAAPGANETASTVPAPSPDEKPNPEEQESGVPVDEAAASMQPITNIPSSNPTIVLGRLMLINPNFPVEPEFIASRKAELVSLHDTYGIRESNSNNGDNLLDKEAAKWMSQMLADYTIANPGHTIETRSCFREVGTSCGRMCAATGESDHHTGLTCDLVDPSYGTILNTDTYSNHPDWQWLKQNSYKYGFIDRFPEAWAGGPMSEPANVDGSGSTGLYETWHYRYVGVYAATQIATGVYNNGEYDSLEHYLKARGLVPDLLNGR